MSNKESYRDALTRAMHDIFTKQPASIVMGQGVNDPIGIFGTTLGLAEKFGRDRVIDTPIMEEGTTGIGIGASLNGLYPVMIHIRADFLLLAINQIVNIAAKYKYTYGGKFCVPFLIRACIGRSWGQGPQHSQSVQSLLAHIPGLTVIMPATAQCLYRDYLHAAVNCKSPVISLEHRLLYDRDFKKDAPYERKRKPFSAAIIEEGADVTIVATSYMVQDAQMAALWLKENTGISCDIIDLNNISLIDSELICKSVQKTGRLIVADTSWAPFGVCAEVTRQIALKDPGLLKKPVREAALAFAPTPTSHALEDLFYPNIRTIIEHAIELSEHKNPVEIPDLAYFKKAEKKFRGPF